MAIDKTRIQGAKDAVLKQLQFQSKQVSDRIVATSRKTLMKQLNLTSSLADKALELLQEERWIEKLSNGHARKLARFKVHLRRPSEKRSESGSAQQTSDSRDNRISSRLDSLEQQVASLEAQSRKLKAFVEKIGAGGAMTSAAAKAVLT
jgi:flagellar capping protein FliD